MKIAILVGGLPPERLGGTEVATHNIARHLAKRGHDVHIITFLDGGLPKESMEQGFYVHRIRFPKVRFVGGILLRVKVLLVLKKFNPDVIHAQNIGNGIFGFWAKKFLRRPYVVWGQGSDVYVAWQFKKQISKLVLPSADAVIALTEDMRGEMQKLCNREIFVIPNGIDLERFENLSRAKARSELQIKETEKIILFVGTLRAVKGVKYLIQAMSIMGQNSINARLILVGNGEERQSLQGLTKELDLEEDVTFVGKVPNEEIPQYMIASDVFVLPSLSESFGIVNLEAMACGLPIVATKVGGLPEIIEEGKNGFLVEPKNLEQIAEKVRLLLGDDELRRRISENNKTRVKEYSWESVVDRLEWVYKCCLKTGSIEGNTN